MKISVGELRQLIRESVTDVVWRGMTGISARDLTKMIGVPPERSGHAQVSKSVPLSKMSWWSDRKSMALIYASTDPVRGPRPGYDVLMRGEVVKPDDDVNITHALRKDMSTTIRITDVCYSLPGPNRKAALEDLSQI